VLNQLNLWLAGIEDISIDNNQYQAFNQVSNSSTAQKSAFNSHSQIEPQT
jgi:biopolymer transport protein ExbB